MTKGTRTDWEAHWIAVASLTVLCLAPAAACAQQRSQTSSSTAQNTAPSPPAKLKLNNHDSPQSGEQCFGLVPDYGSVNDPGNLSKCLAYLFQQRVKHRAYKVGMERRADLPEYQRIEKTVFVKADRSVKLEEVTKTIGSVKDAGAEPLLLPIEAVTEKGGPNPLILFVKIDQPNPRPPSSGDIVAKPIIIDGIPIVLASTANGESLAAITIAKDGEYALGEKRIEKAALEKEIRDRIKEKPGSEKVVFVKAAPDITYGSLEDLYYAAFEAGAKRIDLEKAINWEDQKTVTVPIADLTLTLPTELSEESPSSEPNKNGDITWTHYSYEWKKQGEKPELRVYVFVTNWDNDFPPEAGGFSPEVLLEQSYTATEREKNSGEIEELRYLELDGVKGVFFRAPNRQDKNRINLVWETVRYHKNKAQKLSITIYGVRSDLEKLMKVINSVRLAQK